MNISKIEDAIEDIKQGKMVIVMDHEDRENEGDLVLAAEKVTPEKINFMMKHARGLICVPIIGSRLDELKLPQMTNGSATGNRCAFSVSVDAKHNATTGISAHDRATTINALIDSNTKPEDLFRPGHMFPIRYKEGGVLVRQGHTEASVDLARLAGLFPAGVICEVINDDGTMAKLDDIKVFAAKHDLKIITVDDLVEYVKEKTPEQTISVD
jgi:3,4-dihydroxy 2-butanone 4-phosphate synthase/GTP cyclohydrolase II